MAVFRVERTGDYTVMSNFHLKDKRLSLKAKGLLSQMLSLPDDWDYPLYLDDLNEIVELLVETVCAKRKTTRISGADFPHEIVRSRFLKLDSSHIEFVMDCLQKNTTQVHNIKQYLLAVLFNAPTTMNNHYTSLVNHDMHAGGW